MGEFLTVGAADAVAEGSATAFDVEGAQIGVARVEGRLYAFSDICTHQGCNLTAGNDLDGTQITCECHGSMFAIDTGEVLDGPAAKPIETYAAREVDGQIQIEV
jgi:nitrite reductase/ring-hydroxylating ferredoxin subunit